MQFLEELLYSQLDGPRPMGASAIDGAWAVYNPILASNFLNQRKILTERYACILSICVSF